MKKILLPVAIFCLVSLLATAQTDSISFYKKTSAMIPMRDGIKLYTVILSPVNAKKPSPVLIQRTPYGASIPLPDDTIVPTRSLNNILAEEGYIFVYQDIRGKYKSEGTMQIHQPLIHATQKGAVDESTDTWDAIDWLIKNVPDNNGRAGIYGISYPGWLALVGAVDPHPALKASSEQACMGDLFLGDDFPQYFPQGKLSHGVGLLNTQAIIDDGLLLIFQVEAQHVVRLVGQLYRERDCDRGPVEIIDLLGDGDGMLELLAGVDRQFGRNVVVGSALQGLAVNDVSDDRLEFPREVFVEEFDHLFPGDFGFLHTVDFVRPVHGGCVNRLCLKEMERGGAGRPRAAAASRAGAGNRAG